MFLGGDGAGGQAGQDWAGWRMRGWRRGRGRGRGQAGWREAGVVSVSLSLLPLLSCLYLISLSSLYLSSLLFLPHATPLSSLPPTLPPFPCNSSLLPLPAASSTSLPAYYNLPPPHPMPAFMPAMQARRRLCCLAGDLQPSPDGGGDPSSLPNLLSYSCCVTSFERVW